MLNNWHPFICRDLIGNAEVEEERISKRHTYMNGLEEEKTLTDRGFPTRMVYLYNDIYTILVRNPRDKECRRELTEREILNSTKICTATVVQRTHVVLKGIVC